MRALTTNARSRRTSSSSTTWPKADYSPRLAKIADDYAKLVEKNIQKYLTENPGISKVYMGLGARNKTRRILGAHADKFYGSHTYNNHFDISSKVPDFPGDVWRLVETKTIESSGFTDRLEVSDPEGTALAADLTPEVAQAWAKGVYQQGHLYMFPSQDRIRQVAQCADLSGSHPRHRAMA